MSRVLMVASEATPFVKTGGLADVIGSLPPELVRCGDQVAVVLPWYQEAVVAASRPVLENATLWLGRTAYQVRVHESVVRGVPYYLVECPPLFGRKGIYTGPDGDFTDNHIRFALLSRAALAVARWRFRPQILHCHDWQSALLPVWLGNMLAGDPTFMGVKVLLTIHNLAYQGVFAPSELSEMGLDQSMFHPRGLEHRGDVNLLKGAILSSDAINTVSRAYAAEIQTPEYGCGLDGLLRERAGALFGILNGVDYSEWSPERDRYIAAPYSAADLSGKLACKRDLLGEFGLPDEAAGRPLVGIVSRFASQKGFDLLAEAAGELASMDALLVALGTGEPRYEELLRSLAAAHPDTIAVRIAFDNRLAHKIEAGSDIFLMPSRYEPCGLNQIYSLRYGTVPVVRATGGLDDTIDETTGFKFKEYSCRAMLAALRAALGAYRHPEGWRRIMLNGMAKEYSWASSAGAYSALYRSLADESHSPSRASIA
ncbi:MAG TPA: glycogen synthase GlgA [Bryobacteraceae bacterium]|nr:glycogen synthase GlgA [Bryobacteraceae bacterium]